MKQGLQLRLSRQHNAAVGIPTQTDFVAPGREPFTVTVFVLQLGAGDKEDNMTHEETFVTTSCPVARSVDLLGDRWMLMIIRDAFDGISRFSDFQKNTGVAKNVLAARLRTLTDAGIFTLVPASEGGAYKAYRLTERGLALFPLIVCLRQWGEANLFREGEKMSRLLGAAGQPLARHSVDPSGVPAKPEDLICASRLRWRVSVHRALPARNTLFRQGIAMWLRHPSR
jgi:DNA-binding HxlR family transcriptional regulator